MNTTNRNVKQRNSYHLENGCKQPHFETVRAGQGPTRAFKMPSANVSRDTNLYKNFSAFGAQQFSSVQRSSSGSFDGLSRDFSLESYKKSLNRNINSGNSVLSLLKNSSSLSSSGRIIDTDRQAYTSSCSNVVAAAAPLHNVSSPFITPLPLAAFQTPGSLAKIGPQKRQLTSKTNEPSIESQFFATPKKRSSGRTPKSSSSAITSSDAMNHMVVAITEGRGQARGEVGIAAVDLKRPRLILCQISDTQTYTNTLRKINILNPAEILLPNTFCDVRNSSKLYQIICDEFPNANIVTVQRKVFNDEHGLAQVQNICLPDYSSVLLIIQRKFYALAAAAAVLKYAEFEQNVLFASKSTCIDYESGDKITFIDLVTAQRLELVTSQNTGNVCPANTLFGVLNNCSTAGGQRRLRGLILQPSSDRNEINVRLDCVEELINDSNLFHSLKTLLPKFWDVEQLLSLCMQINNMKDNMKAAELQINYALLLKSSLEAIPALHKALSAAKSDFFRNFRQTLGNVQYKNMLSKIYETINDDAHLSQKFDVNQIQRCFCIKSGKNAFLDIARMAYTELVQDYSDVVEDLISEYKLPLTVKTLRSKGPILQMKIPPGCDFNVKDLPSIFIQVEKLRSTITMTTKELLFLKERMNHFIQEIQFLTSSEIFDMLEEIREYIGSLYVLCENIAELDVVTTFAQMGKTLTYVRPIFSNNRTDVKGSVHPILNRVSTSKPVANDIFASNDKNVTIITGPNMGGKSVYIRQVALLQIMAQMGCYVPATSAEFRITDRIFSRIGFNDNIECNASSFLVEMKEMHYIQQSITPNSLVIIDELCRSTSTEEGTSLAWAILEELLATTAFVFFTTHFLFLTKLEDLYCNVINYHFQALEIESDENSLPSLVYTHRLVAGVIELEHYGLKLAKSTALGDGVLKLGEEIAEKLSIEWKASSARKATVSKDKQIDEVILCLLDMVDNNTLTIDSVRGVVDYVQEAGLLANEDVNDTSGTRVGTCASSYDSGYGKTYSTHNPWPENEDDSQNLDETPTPTAGTQPNVEEMDDEENMNGDRSSSELDDTLYSLEDDEDISALPKSSAYNISESSSQEQENEGMRSMGSSSASSLQNDFFMLKSNATAYSYYMRNTQSPLANKRRKMTRLNLTESPSNESPDYSYGR